jgi:phosphatidate cytidylyltransferase
MLKHRLFFGILMTVAFTGLVLLDGWLDVSFSGQAGDSPLHRSRQVGAAGDKTPQARILALLIAILIILAQLELANLASAKRLKIFIPVSTIASILLATTWYWPQFIEVSPHTYLFFVMAFTLLGLFLYQFAFFGTTDILANCGVNCFSIIYLGLFSGFVLAVRLDFGLWPVLMFIFVVKSSDIGAYAIGTLFGKHKFSPKISPSKTWEGMAAAASTAMVVAFVFAAGFDIMEWWLALIFGFCFACIAQTGDLIESMIKRDAEQKDSGNKVPGFGGVLDIVDSPLVAAPFAYLFFLVIRG